MEWKVDPEHGRGTAMNEFEFLIIVVVLTAYLSIFMLAQRKWK